MLEKWKIEVGEEEKHVFKRVSVDTRLIYINSLS
jgi:hypothetical protein